MFSLENEVAKSDTVLELVFRNGLQLGCSQLRCRCSLVMIAFCFRRACVGVACGSGEVILAVVNTRSNETAKKKELEF